MMSQGAFEIQRSSETRLATANNNLEGALTSLALARQEQYSADIAVKTAREMWTASPRGKANDLAYRAVLRARTRQTEVTELVQRFENQVQMWTEEVEEAKEACIRATGLVNLMADVTAIVDAWREG